MSGIVLIIKLRFIQLFKALSGGGIIRIFFVITVFLIANAVLFNELAKGDNDRYFVFGYLALIFLIHIKRSDILFLKISFEHYKTILFSEYFLLSLPLITALLLYQNRILLSASIIFLTIIPNINIKLFRYSLNTKIQQLIPGQCFEWKAGSRQYFFLLIFLWFSGVFAAFYFASVPVVLFIIGIILLSFYEKSEPLSILLAFEISSKKLLLNKIKIHSILYTVFVFPLIIAFIAFHTAYWYIPLIEYFLFLSLHIFIIISKYAFYKPNIKTSGSQIMSALGSVALFIPVFIPVVWILSVYLFFKAQNNLNFYLDDFN